MTGNVTASSLRVAPPESTRPVSDTVIRRIPFALAALAGAAYLTACSGDHATSPDHPSVASIEVSADHTALLVGQTAQLTAAAKDSAGSIMSGVEISFASSDTSVAKVTAAGVVIAAAAGGATMFASASGKSGSIGMTITAPPPPPGPPPPPPPPPPPSGAIHVGPTRTYKTPCAAIAIAAVGDTIDIDAATYSGDVCVITTANLTLRGVGGRPTLDAAGKSAQGKAIWVIHTTNTTVENIEFANAVVPDDNGAGIKLETGDLTVRNCYFYHNQDGLLTNADSTSDIVVEGTEFAFSGNTPDPGFMHNIYIGAAHSFTLRYSYSHDVFDGNLVKSRAANNYILYNRISGETSTDSYELDLPNGGRSYVIGNIIEQGPSSPNHSIIEYGAEGVRAGYASDLFVVNNTIVNDESVGTFVNVAAGVTTPAVLRNNIFAGPGTVTNQASAVLQSNRTAADGDPKFANRAAYDYHLLAGSPAIDAGSAPGSAFGFSLVPVLQYVHPTQSVTRTVLGAAIDVGAYEHAP